MAASEEAKASTNPAGNSVPTSLPVVPSDSVTMGHPPKHFFLAKTVTVKATVQPLWTPDNYQPAVKALVESARRSFYMQTQYIHPGVKAGDQAFDLLIAAIGQFVAGGVDVRLIRSVYQSDDWIEKLVTKDTPSAVLRRQHGVHNNDIMVDHESVMIGSHNWSADGVLRNWDAGLIVQYVTVATYFEQVFLHDWEHLAALVMA